MLWYFDDATRRVLFNDYAICYIVFSLFTRLLTRLLTCHIIYHILITRPILPYRNEAQQPDPQ